MTARYMLDTDTVSFAFRGVGEVGERLLRCRPSEVCISAITLGELRFGAERRRSKKLHGLIDVFTQTVAVLPFDELAAAKFATLGAALAAEGRPIGQLDTLIAAHAASLHLVLVTNNTKHFGRIRGLRTENWVRETS